MLQCLKGLRYIIKPEQCSDLKAVSKFLQLFLHWPYDLRCSEETN